MTRLCAACVVLFLTAGTPGAQQGAETSAAVTGELLRKGGEHWSAPEKERGMFGSVSAGSRFWIWPAEDRIQVLRRRTPTITLSWRLQPQQQKDVSPCS